MKKLITIVLGLIPMAGVAIAGSIDSPGAPSSGSGMYTIGQLYDYLNSGLWRPHPALSRSPQPGRRLAR